MSESLVFYPPHRLGLTFQALVILVLAVVGGWGFWQATQAQLGPVFLLFLLPSLVMYALIPIFAYRGYALWRASYEIEREGVRLRWGLREEVIPMDQVSWIQLVDPHGAPLPLPRGRWPGAVLGNRQLPDGSKIEFLAAQTHDLIVIASERGNYVISPSHPNEFLHAYRRFAEMGSFTPLEGYSAYPTFLLSRVWASRLARVLLVSGVALSLILLVVVSFYVPNHQSISFRFSSTGEPLEQVASVQLILLPILNFFFLLMDFLAGLYFYRFKDSQILSFLIWGVGVLTAVLFLIAVLFIMRLS